MRTEFAVWLHNNHLNLERSYFMRHPGPATDVELYNYCCNYWPEKVTGWAIDSETGRIAPTTKSVEVNMSQFIPFADRYLRAVRKHFQPHADVRKASDGENAVIIFAADGTEVSASLKHLADYLKTQDAIDSHADITALHLAYTWVQQRYLVKQSNA